MLTEFSLQTSAAVILVFALSVFYCLVKASSSESTKQVKELRKAATAIQRLDQEISELTDCCSDALDLDMRPVRWNLLIARVRNARAIGALENDDLVTCVKWLNMAQKAVDNAHKRFHSAPECHFSGQAEVTIDYLNGNW
jgi:hypothetical protein